MPLPKNPIKAKESQKKMSEAQKKLWEGSEHRQRMSEKHTGKTQSKETIEKRVAKIKGQRRSPRITKKCPVCGMELSLTVSEKNRKFCSTACKGKWQSEHAIGENGAHWKGGSITKKCEECGKEFSIEKNRMNKAKFCSLICKAHWMSKNIVGENNPTFGKPGKNTKEKHWAWKGGDVTKKCEECGKEFVVEQSRKNEARFCSRSCKGIWMSKNLVGEKNPTWRRIAKICEECGKTFFVKTRRKETGRFCSMSCHGKWMSKNLSGQNNSNWTGGPKEYCEKWSLEFRRRIRAFFDYKCAECGIPQKDKLLHCHHVYYDKKACCNVIENGKYVSNLGIKEHPFSFEIIGDPNKFIALCDSCHKSTSGKKNREYWARHFEAIINDYYLGRSYFTKDEYEKIK